MKKDQKYILIAQKPEGLSARLAAICAPGKPGEHLIRNGFSQGGFARLIAAIAKKIADRSESEIAKTFGDYSACNASAARQALEKCNIQIFAIDGEDDELDEEFHPPVGEKKVPRELSLSSYWGKNPSSGAALSPDEIAALF